MGVWAIRLWNHVQSPITYKKGDDVKKSPSWWTLGVQWWARKEAQKSWLYVVLGQPLLQLVAYKLQPTKQSVDTNSWDLGLGPLAPPKARQALHKKKVFKYFRFKNIWFFFLVKNLLWKVENFSVKILK